MNLGLDNLKAEVGVPRLNEVEETIVSKTLVPLNSNAKSGDDSLSTASLAPKVAINAGGSQVCADDLITDAGTASDGNGQGSPPVGVEKLEEWLSNNIAEFINFIHTYSTSGDREKRWAIIRYIQRQTSIFLGQQSSLHPSQVAVPFGSFTYGMYLPWASDLDIVLTGQAFLDNPEVMLKRLANHFSKQRNHCIQAPPVVVSKTRVPFVQLLLAPPHHARGLIDQSACGLCRMGYSNLCPSHSPVSVQISLAVKDHAGLVSTASVNYLVAHYPVIRGLVLVLKHILVSENLNSPFEGGLSSHSLIILVTAFVRHFHPHDHNIALPGTLLLQMLCWYAGIETGCHKVYAHINDKMCSSFDPAVMTVDVKSDSDCYRKKEPTEQTELLYVVDPLDITHNAARSMWRWTDLKNTLTSAYWHVYSGKWWTAMGANTGQSSPINETVNPNLPLGPILPLSRSSEKGASMTSKKKGNSASPPSTSSSVGHK
jgi:hypothetical protein